MEKKAISIVIPTKNEAAYIGRTIEQFRDYVAPRRLEIIVSDAGSHDGTLDVVRRYQQEWGADVVKYAVREGKQNIAMGRNLGAAQATGDLLFHMDADVVIPHIDRFFTAVERVFSRPEVVAATGPLWVYPEEAILSDKLYHILMNGVIRLSFLLGVYLAKGECQLVRRSVFEKIGGYNEKLIAGEDCNLFYRLSKVGRVAYRRHLRIYHSPRRFRKYGYVGVSAIYLREGLSLLFRGKSYVEEWTPVR